jgi:hypothetical protein
VDARFDRFLSGSFMRVAYLNAHADVSPPNYPNNQETVLFGFFGAALS